MLILGPPVYGRSIRYFQALLTCRSDCAPVCPHKQMWLAVYPKRRGFNFISVEPFHSNLSHPSTGPLRQGCVAILGRWQGSGLQKRCSVDAGELLALMRVHEHPDLRESMEAAQIFAEVPAHRPHREQRAVLGEERLPHFANLVPTAVAPLSMSRC